MSNQKAPTDLVSKAAGATLDPASSALVNALVGSITKGQDLEKSPSLVQNTVGALIGDWVGEWRSRRLIAFITKTAQVAKQHGIDADKLSALPNGERYKILDSATKTDDPLIEAMWSSLLLSELPEDESRDRLIRLLENMTGNDAKVLTFIYSADLHRSQLMSALAKAAEIKLHGYEGDKKSLAMLRENQPQPSKEEYKKLLDIAEKEIKISSEPIKKLEEEFLNGEVYLARDHLLRLGLIQRRIINVPEGSDFRKNQEVFMKYRYYEEDSEEWGDLESCDPDAVASAIDGLHDLIAEHTGYSRSDTESPGFVDYKNRFNPCPWVLTPLGESFYQACALRV